MMPGTQTLKGREIEKTYYPNGKIRLEIIKHPCGSETTHKFREDGTAEYKQNTFTDGESVRYIFDKKGKHCNHMITQTKKERRESFYCDFYRDLIKTVVSRPGKEDYTIWGRAKWA